MITCKVCRHDETEAIEEWGKEALAGDMSWRAVEQETARYGISRQSLKNHMETHFAKAIERSLDTELLAIESEFDESVREAVADLFVIARNASPEDKPLYLAMIHNLKGLADTKPSQQHLILAQKTIQDRRGNDVILQFAQAMFGELAGPVRLPALDVSSSELPALTEASYASSSLEEVNK